MTSIEELLVRDVSAVTGGIIVTDSDLQVARMALADRVEDKRQRGRRRTIVLTTAAAVVLGAAGGTAFLTLGGDEKALQPAGSGPDSNGPDASHLVGSAPTAQLLDGVWRVDDTGIVVKFAENGTARIDNHGALFSRPATTGTYVIDGDRITVSTSTDAEAECKGTKVALRASFPDSGEMRFVSDTTDACSPFPPGQGRLEKLLPTGRSMAGLVFSKDPDFRPLTDKVRLYGIWLAEGGGHLLEMDPDGAYFIADDTGVPIDRGAWSFRGSELTLTSSALSTACSQGDTYALGGVQHERASSTSGLRGTVKQNTCGGAWTPAAWILIPHVGS